MIIIVDQFLLSIEFDTLHVDLVISVKIMLIDNNKRLRICNPFFKKIGLRSSKNTFQFDQTMENDVHPHIIAHHNVLTPRIR